MNNHPSRKLVGWKAIAEYLNTSVRTAERWEQELSLPVHHAGGSKGYSVFADVEELEAWLAEAKGSGLPSHDRVESGIPIDLRRQTPKWRPPRWLAIAAMVVVAAGFILAVLWFREAQRPKIGSITFQGRQLLAWSNGEVAWWYDFGQPTRGIPPGDLVRRFRILPLKGNHDGEVLVAAPLLQLEAGDFSTDGIYCFSSAGKLLWRHAFTDRIRFGGEDCGPRWEIQALRVTGEGTALSAWCTICSYPKSVSMVVKIDPNGTTTRYFVNYGHLGRLTEWHGGDASYLLAGGINNETDDGALAVLGEAEPSGHSPQAQAFSACDACPPGQPYRYFVFPRSELIRVTGEPYNGVFDILPSNPHIQVMTFEGTGVGGGIWALYDISETLAPESVSFSDKYRLEHEQLSAEGKIKHTLDACPERLKPIVVREWSPQEGWKNILLPPIESRAVNSAMRK